MKFLYFLNYLIVILFLALVWFLLCTVSKTMFRRNDE